MSIQRKHCEIQVSQSEEKEEFAVQLIVIADGKYESREDALLMIADAWVQLMEDAGFNPDSSFQTLRNHGKLH